MAPPEIARLLELTSTALLASIEGIAILLGAHKWWLACTGQRIANFVILGIANVRRLGSVALSFVQRSRVEQYAFLPGTVVGPITVKTANPDPDVPQPPAGSFRCLVVLRWASGLLGVGTQSRAAVARKPNDKEEPDKNVAHERHAIARREPDRARRGPSGCSKMVGMDSDSDPPLATTAPRSQHGATPPQEEKTPWAEVFGLAKLWDAIVGWFWLGVLLAILGGIGYGVYAGAIWVKEQYFDTADSVLQKAAKCYEDAEKYHLGTKKCDELSERVGALSQREAAEKFCKDQGLRFKGKIDQVECAP